MPSLVRTIGAFGRASELTDGMICDLRLGNLLASRQWVRPRVKLLCRDEWPFSRCWTELPDPPPDIKVIQIVGRYATETDVW